MFFSNGEKTFRIINSFRMTKEENVVFFKMTRECGHFPEYYLLILNHNNRRKQEKCIIKYLLSSLRGKTVYFHQEASNTRMSGTQYILKINELIPTRHISHQQT